MNALNCPDTTSIGVFLKMFRQAPENKNCCFLFIEGEDDIKFWKTRLIEKNCRIVFLVSFSPNNKKKTGKTQVIKNIQALNENDFEGALAIVDNDFDPLFNIQNKPNICVTETHDLETLLLKSSFVFQKVLSEYGDSQLIAKFEEKNKRTVQDYLVDLTLPFARIEWLKQNLQPNLKLGSLHKNNTFLIPDKWCVAQDQLNKFAQEKNIDISTEESKKLLQKINNINPWLLCQGHVMIDILSIGFQKGTIGNNRRATSDTIASYIRGAIDTENLYKTKLCQSIFSWQQQNRPYKFLE